MHSFGTHAQSKCVVEKEDKVRDRDCILCCTSLTAHTKYNKSTFPHLHGKAPRDADSADKTSKLLHTGSGSLACLLPHYGGTAVLLLQNRSRRLPSRVENSSGRTMVEQWSTTAPERWVSFTATESGTSLTFEKGHRSAFGVTENGQRQAGRYRVECGNNPATSGSYSA